MNLPVLQEPDAEHRGQGRQPGGRPPGRRAAADHVLSPSRASSATTAPAQAGDQGRPALRLHVPDHPAGKEFKGSPALDAGLIGAAQAVEHYEMARYGTLRAWARELGLNGRMIS